MRLDKIDIVNKLVLFGVTLAWGLIFVLRLNIPPVIDEVGSIANPAYLLGWDWSETAWSTGGCYFKYGFSLLYYPFMRFIEDSYDLYKAMLGFNMVFMAVIPVIVYDIFHKYLYSGKLQSLLFGFASAVFPSTVLYMTYAKADVILIFLPFPILLIFLELGRISLNGFDPYHKRYNKIKRVILSILLAGLTIYAYMSHTRGLAVVLAVLFAIVLIRLVCRIRTVEYISFTLTCVVMFLIDRKLSSFFKNALYGVYGTQYSSPESYDFEALKQIFSKEGFEIFRKLVVGTAFNSIVSSYGLVLIGIIAGIVLLVRYLRSSASVTDEEMITVIFSVLVFAGTFAMSCLYFFPYVTQIFSGMDRDRADWLVYGRYTACSAGPLVVLGLYLLVKRIKHFAITEKILTAAIFALVYFSFSSQVAPLLETMRAVTRNFIQLCTFVELGGYGLTSAVIEGLGDAVCKAGILAAAVGGIMLVFSFIPEKVKTLKTILVTAAFIIASVVITVANYDNIRISRDDMLMTWTKDPCSVLESLKELAGDYPVLVDSSAKSIKHYQFVCKEFTLGSALTKTANAKNCFIIAKKKYFVNQFYNDDYYVFDDFDYKDPVMDIVYIKGEKLAKKLKKMGVSVSKYKGKLKDSPKADNAI